MDPEEKSFLITLGGLISIFVTSALFGIIVVQVIDHFIRGG